MFLESIPAMPENITQQIAISASNAVKPVLSQIFYTIKPFVIAISSLIGLYIIYKIISALINYFIRKRIKRIDENVIKLNEKVEEILGILKKKSKKR